MGHLRALQPLLSVEFLVANEGWVASPVKAVSRRRWGPQARLYRACHPAILGHRGRRLATQTQPGVSKPGRSTVLPRKRPPWVNTVIPSGADFVAKVGELEPGAATFLFRGTAEGVGVVRPL